MRDQIDCKTSDGGWLRFALYRDGRPLSPAGGNFLYVKTEAAGPLVIFAGQTDNLAQNAEVRWAEARARYGVEALYTRLNITAVAREREHDELIATLAPPMNAAEAGGAS